MGVDYDANFGIGVEITGTKFEEDEDFNMEEYLGDILENTEYDYFQVGNGGYTGEENDFFVIIKKPFENGYNLTEKILEFKEFLNKNDIEYEKIDIVGGLEVW